MRKSILRLITVCATVALLCGAMLCFSLSSSAENLLTDSWAALDDSQSAAVSYSGGTLTINAGTDDVKAAQKLTLDAGSYQFLIGNKTGDMWFTVKWDGGEASEIKYDEQHIEFTLPSSKEVTIEAFQYRNTTGTASAMTLEKEGGSSGTTASSEASESSATQASETQPSQQGGSTELTDNWEALDPAQAAAVSFSNGTLSINAGLVEGDVKAGQTVSLAAGTYTLTADKTGDLSFSAKWEGNEVGETEGKLTFTLPAETKVQIVAFQYRGTSGTASNIVLSGGGSQPTTPSSSETTPSSSETTPSSSETTPSQSETQPSQQGGSTELTDNWEALDPAQAAAVSFSNGTLSINAGLVEGDVKAGQTVSLAAGTYTLTADKTGDLSFSAKWEGNEVGETEGKLTFTLPAATDVQIVAFQYRGTSGTASNIVLSGGGSQPTTPSASSSETTPSGSGSETQPTSAPTGGNLIVNGSFNSGISGWTLTNIDENSAKVQDGALVVNQANGWHVDIRPTISGTIKANTQYTLKYEASNVNNLQVTVHLAPGFGGGASIQAAPGETSFTTAADLTANDFYVTIEIIADGDVSGTFDNFVLVEGTNTDVTDPSVDPSQSGTQPSQNPSQNPGQVGKIVVWSGTISRDFTTKNTVAIINVDELTQAFRDDLTANGLPQKYEIEAVASYTSGPSGYASWGFYQDSPYLELWSDEGATLTNAVISGQSKVKTPLSSLTNAASLCLFSDNSGDLVNVQSLTLYAYREGGTTTPSSSETTPSSSETDPSSSETTPSGSETDPSTSETTPSQPTDGKALVWAGNLDTDYTTGDGGVAPIQNQEMMMAVMGEIMTNGIPEKIEIKSELGYLGGPSNFAAIGLYSNGQVIWPDAECTDLSDVTFSNLSGLGADTALVVFSTAAGDTLHIGNMEIYAYRAQPTEPSSSVMAGDANGDGALNMKDVLVLRKFLADIPVEMNAEAADVNGDGSINMKDVLQMRKIIADS